MKKVEIKTLKEYESKYKTHYKNLLKIKKQEVIDFDNIAGCKGEQKLLKNRKWVLLGDTYYEIPKAPRWTWFKGLSTAGKLITCGVLVGSAGVIGGTSYGIYAAVNNSNKPVVVIDEELKDVIKVNKVTTNSKGDTVITIEVVDRTTEPKPVAVYKGEQLLVEDKDYEVDDKSDFVADFIIYKATMNKYPGKIIFKVGEQPEEGVEVTEEEWIAACNYLLFPNEATRNVSIEEKMIDTEGGVETCFYYLDGPSKKEKYVSTDSEIEYRTIYNDNYYKCEDGVNWENIGDGGYCFDNDIDLIGMIYQLSIGYDVFTYKNGTYTCEVSGSKFSVKFKMHDDTPYIDTYIMPDAGTGGSVEAKFSDYSTTTIENFPPFTPEPEEGEVTEAQWQQILSNLLPSNMENRNFSVDYNATISGSSTSKSFFIDKIKEEYDVDEQTTLTTFRNDKYYKYDDANEKWVELSPGRTFNFDEDELVSVLLPTIINDYNNYEFSNGVYSKIDGTNTYIIKFNTDDEPYIDSIIIKRGEDTYSYIFYDVDDTEIDGFPQFIERGVEVTSDEFNNALNYLISNEKSYQCDIYSDDEQQNIQKKLYVKDTNVKLDDFSTNEEVDKYEFMKDDTVIHMNSDGYVYEFASDNTNTTFINEIGVVYTQEGTFGNYTYNSGTKRYETGNDNNLYAFSFMKVDGNPFVDYYLSNESGDVTKYVFNNYFSTDFLVSEPNNLLDCSYNSELKSFESGKYLEFGINNNRLCAFDFDLSEKEFTNKKLKIELRNGFESNDDESYLETLTGVVVDGEIITDGISIENHIAYIDGSVLENANQLTILVQSSEPLPQGFSGYCYASIIAA